MRGGANPPLTIHKQIDNILTKEKEKKLTYTLLDTLEKYKEATMNDIENDRNIIFTLRTDTIELVHKLQDFQKKQAFAIEQGNLLTQVIDRLDDILADVCEPKEEELNKARDYHEQLTTERHIS